MRRDRLLTALRALAGLLAGIAIWWAFAVPYNRLLTATADPLFRLFERPRMTRLHVVGDRIAIDRADRRRGDQRPGLATSQLTVNFVLLTALFAANRKPLETRNVGGFLVAAIGLAAVHVAAIIANVHSIYAVKLGEWSERNYGVIERNFWAGAAHFYIVVGSFASAFLLWWLLRPSGGDGPRPRRRTRRRG